MEGFVKGGRALCKEMNSDIDKMPRYAAHLAMAWIDHWFFLSGSLWAFGSYAWTSRQDLGCHWRNTFFTEEVLMFPIPFQFIFSIWTIVDIFFCSSIHFVLKSSIKKEHNVHFLPIIRFVLSLVSLIVRVK